MTKATLHRAYVRTCWRLSSLFPPAMRVLLDHDEPANDNWHPVDAA